MDFRNVLAYLGFEVSGFLTPMDDQPTADGLGDVDPDLFDTAEAYLDGTLPEAEATRFEQAILEDRQTREALVQAIAHRGLLGLAGLGATAGVCEAVRALLPSYRANVLGPVEVGRLARHLDRCKLCSAYYEGLTAAVPRRERSKLLRWPVGLLLFLLGGFVAGCLLWILWAPNRR